MESWMVFVIGFCVVSPVYSGLTSKDKNEVKPKDPPLAHPPHIEDGFKTIHKMDDQECIPRLLCELAVTSQKSTLSNEEASILAVFSNGNDKVASDKNAKSDGSKSPLSIYKFATDIGKLGQADDRCQKNFSKCPLTGNDLMLAFKNIIVKH